MVAKPGAVRHRSAGDWDPNLPKLPRAHPDQGLDLKTVALLLDDANNRYQQLLARQAKAHAPRRKLRLLPPVFAHGSSWTQIETINQYLRSASPPDALLIMPAGEQHTGSWLERAVSKNLAVVLLNRLPGQYRQQVSERPGGWRGTQASRGR